MNANCLQIVRITLLVDDDKVLTDGYITPDNHSSDEYGSGLVTLTSVNSDFSCDRLRSISQKKKGEMKQMDLEMIAARFN